MNAPRQVFDPVRCRTVPAWLARLEIRLKMRAARRRYAVPLPLTGAGFLALRRRAGISLGWVALTFEVNASEIQRFESGIPLGGGGLFMWQAPPERLRPLCGEALR